MNKTEMKALVGSITTLSTLVTKEFEKIGFINQVVQTPLRQASRKLNEIADLVSFIEFKKSEDRSDSGDNGSGDTRTNTDQQERQIKWKIDECKELAAAYADLSEAMKESTGKSPFENDWTRGIVDGISELG